MPVTVHAELGVLGQEEFGELAFKVSNDRNIFLSIIFLS